MNWIGWLLRSAFLLAASQVVHATPDGMTFVLPDAPAMERLRAGDWILSKEVEARSGAAASIMLFIQAPVERIWEVIISCDYAMAWVDGLEYCEVLEDRGDYALIRQIVDKGWATPTIDYTFATRRIPLQSMQLTLINGNLKVFQGSWEFSSLPGGVLLRHTLALQPNFPVPRWLIRRTLLRDMPDMMVCLRGLSGGSGSAESSAEERRKCPGVVRKGHD